MFRKSIALSLLSAFLALDAPASEPIVEAPERDGHHSVQSTEPTYDFTAENLRIQLDARRRVGRHYH